jgi:hypothetical protein
VVSSADKSAGAKTFNPSEPSDDDNELRTSLMNAGESPNPFQSPNKEYNQ